MEKRGHYDSVNEDYYINISANSNTLKSILILEKDYQVDFNHQNSLAKVLGFTGAKYTEGFHESENVVNILRINSILVNIDIISGSYVNGTTKSTIYSFFPKVSPGYKSIESPVNLVYLPLTLDTIDRLVVSITDQVSRDNLLSERTGELELQTDLSKFYRPITETQKATAREITEGLKPIREGIEKLPQAMQPTGEATGEAPEEEVEKEEDE